jgi:hypothetical protein
MSRKRDGGATGIAVHYIRELAKCRSELRLRRVRERFRHVVRAHDIWQNGGTEELEIQTRILARQNDKEIGLETGLPPETVQAYGDLFFAVRDRLHAASFVQFQIIGMHPRRPPTLIQLMQMCAFVHGPHMIEPWFQYLQEDSVSRDLTSAADRMTASIELFVSAHTLPDDAETYMSVLKRLPFVFKNERKSAVSVPVTVAFRKSTHAIIVDLELPRVDLQPLSYAPGRKPSPDRTEQRDKRKSA